MRIDIKDIVLGTSYWICDELIAGGDNVWEHAFTFDGEARERVHAVFDNEAEALRHAANLDT